MRGFGTAGLLLLAIAFSGWAGNVVAAEMDETTTSTARLRAVWASTLGPGLDSPQQIDALVGAARTAHLNTIVAQVRHRGITYFKSDLEPLAPPVRLLSGFDPLANLLKEAHETSQPAQRLNVYAWLNVFSIAGMRSLDNEQSSGVLKLFDEGRTLNTSGTKIAFLDPALPEVQDHLVSLVRECVDGYDVDGINLDYVRYPDNGGGWHPKAVERFNRLTKRSGRPLPDDAEWNQFRRDQITAFVRRCAAVVWDERPEVLFTINAVGYGAPGSSFEESAPYTQVNQDWAGWVKEGCLDGALRMGYKRDHIPAQALQYRQWADFSLALQQSAGGPFVSLGIGGYFNELPCVMDQIREAEKRGLGSSIFSYNRPLANAEEARETSEKSPLWPRLGATIFAEYVAAPDTHWRDKIGVVAVRALRTDGSPADGAEVTITSVDGLTTAVPKLLKADVCGYAIFFRMPPGSYRITAPGTDAHGQVVKAVAKRVTRVGWRNE